MILNLLHRPRTGEFFPLFTLQQDWAHELKLKVTLPVPLPAMYDDEVVAAVKRYAEQYGDELGIFLSELDCEAFRKQIGCPMDSFWLYSRADKRRIAEMVLEEFRRCFGREPASVAAYHLDAASIEILKELCPSIKTAAAGCFEEGVRMYHGCNHSWYIFNEGGPWWPWYPAKGHSLRPAADKDDWAGLVALPHLVRDMALSYEGRNDFWASHPGNVMRGLGNIGEKCPYCLNLIDQYLEQEKYNDGYSYYTMFVGPNWLTHSMNVEDPPEAARKLYRESLEYLARLRDEGRVTDMTMSQFADWFGDNRPIGRPEVFWAKEMLYGSGKHYLWYIDPHLRVTIDPTQGGSIGDLRPYAAKVAGFTGPDSPAMADGSYPYLIQSQHRSGAVTHCYDGARTTLAVAHNGQTLDLCRCRTKVASVQRDADGTHVRLTAAKLRFADGLTAEIETAYRFVGEGKIVIERKLSAASDPAVELSIIEYVKGCYGTNEYPQDMHGIRLAVAGANDRELEYEYRSRTIRTDQATAASAKVPQLGCELRLESMDGPADAARAEEGFMFNPFYTLTMEGKLKVGRTFRTCLSVRENRGR